MFVNSDGNLSFTRGDVATDDRSLGRVLGGPPRAALFFADLDPTKGGGIFVSSAASAFTVTWCSVPDFDNTGRVTAQATLLPGGSVEMRFDSGTTLRDGIVALSPGATSAFAAVDLSAAGAAAAGGAGAVGERFASERSFDLAGAARVFYSEFGDSYDQLVFWTDTRVTDSDTFAFESTVKNQIRGIGQGTVDLAAEYGSGGRLASVVLMDTLTKYPADPNQRVNGENTVAVAGGPRDRAPLGGHTALPRRRREQRRLARAPARALELLHRLRRVRARGQRDPGRGRELPHHGAVAALLAVRPLRDGRAARVGGAGHVLRLEPRDHRAHRRGGFNRESAPRSGVSMTGSRSEVTIGAVVAEMGARSPTAGSGPRVHRQAWIYVTSAGRAADPAAIAKLETFRRAFEDFFAQATGGRMSVETRLE